MTDKGIELMKPKAPKREVFDLVFDESYNSDYIEDVFGVNYDIAHKIREKFSRWLAFEEHESYTQAWADFLESDVFEKIGWKPKTPNDYLILGYCFSGGKYKYADKMGGGRGDRLQPCDLLRALKG